MSLKESTLSGVKWNLLSTVINTVFGIVSLWILSHILSPQMYGIISLALIVSTFCSMLLDFGISNSIIRSQTIEKIELSSLSILNFLLGFIIFVIVEIFSSHVSNFLNAGDLLTQQIRLMAFGFIILSFGLQGKALLTREMMFKQLAQISIVTTIVNFVLVIILAYIYRSALCIAVAFLCSSFVGVVITRIMAKKLMIYKMRFQFSAIKKHIRYGVQLVLDSIINQISINVYPILMSKLISVVAIGGYSLSYNISVALIDRLNPVLSHALFPAFSKIGNDELVLKKSLLKVTTFCALVNFPMFIGMLLIADPLIHVFFDKKWIFIIPIVQTLCMVGAIRSLDPPVISVLLVKARMNLNVRLGIIKLFIGIPLTWLLGVKFGLLGIVYSFLLVQLFNTICGYFFLIKIVLGSMGLEYFKAVVIPFLHVLPLSILGILFLSLSGSFNYIYQLNHH